MISPANGVPEGDRGGTLGYREETPNETLVAKAERIGTSGERNDAPTLDWASPVNKDQVRQRFEMLSGSVRSKDQYWRSFETFANAVGLWRLTRKQLRSRGKMILVPYLNSLGDHSRKFVACRIKKVWRKGLDLPWPVENDELAPSAEPRLIEAPRRSVVEPWVHATRSERDLYERSWFLFELNHGLRPVDQQAELRRRDLVFNEATGKPLGIVVKDPTDRGFKRDAVLITALGDEEADAITAWLGSHPDGSGEARIWPKRLYDGEITASEAMTEPLITAMRRRFAKRWRLQWITSKGLRHFVRTVLNHSGMPATERNYWQGHKPNLNSMDERYGRLTMDETLESQRRYLPSGVVGTFLTTETANEVPSEIADIYKRLRAKEIDATEAAEAMRTLVRQQERLLAR
jgi:hypothetical protein